MRDDPAGLSHCVTTRWATYLAFAHRREAGRPAASLFGPGVWPLKPPSRGRRGITPQSRKRVKVISPGYPVVFVSRTARCSGTVLFNDSPQSGKLMKHSPVTITPLARIHG